MLHVAMAIIAKSPIRPSSPKMDPDKGLFCRKLWLTAGGLGVAEGPAFANWVTVCTVPPEVSTITEVADEGVGVVGAWVGVGLEWLLLEEELVVDGGGVVDGVEETGADELELGVAEKDELELV